MKKAIITSISCLGLVTLPSLALAADTLPTPTPAPAVVAASDQPDHLSKLKTHGTAEIDRRLAALQFILTRVQAGSLSDADKSKLAKELQGEITSLTALRAKLAADTSLAAARIDVQAVINEYKIYGLLLPKAQLVVLADRAGVMGKKFQELLTKLQAKVDGAKAKGHDVTRLQKSLDDMKAKMADAQAKYEGLVAKVIDLSPNNYNANHKLLAQYPAVFKDIKADFKAAHDDAQSVILALKNFK